MSLKELEQLPHGTQLESMVLVIKTARKPFEVNSDEGDEWWQEVIFMDATGEMPGEILVSSYTPEPGTKNENRITPSNTWHSKQKIFLISGEIQDSDVRRKEKKKIKVFECRDMAINLTFDQYNEISQAETASQLQSRTDEIRGKCRTLIVMHFINGYTQHYGYEPPFSEERTETLDRWVEYAMTGK